MATQRKRGYILTEIGYCKIINVLNKQEVKPRYWASSLKKQTAEIGEHLDDDTTRKILKKHSVDESSIQSVFKALKLPYQPDKDIILAAKCSNTTIPSSVLYQNLPRCYYQSFIGREAEIQKLLTLLSQSNSIISVESISGTGKTTLVLEAAYRCLQARQNGAKSQNLPNFDAFIFTSAKQQRFLGKGLSRCFQKESKQADILRKIAETIEFHEINNCLDPKEQLNQLKNRLKNMSTLLIIDNLETLEDKEDIESLLYELPVSVTVVITSREQTLLHNCIKLEPLSPEDSLKFIDSKAKEVGVILDTTEIKTIYDTTGGMPGAIMYAIGLLRAYYSLDLTLSQLKQPNKDINKFWFEGHLQKIRKQPAYYLLMALAIFPESALEEAIVAVALPEADKFTISKGLAQLQQLLLINKQEGRYVISLPLTRTYASGELDANCHFEEKARERWINWYLEYSHKYGRKNEKEWHKYEELQLEWENLQDVIKWCISQDRYEDFLQLWHNINCYSHAQGYYVSDRTTTWKVRLDWINWLTEAAKSRGKWSDVAELTFDQARTLTLIGNKFKEAKPLFVQAWKLSRRLDKDIDFKLQLASHIVYLRWKELKVNQANLWLRFSEKILQLANLEEATANRHRFYIFYFRGKISEYSQDYDAAIENYNQALKLAEAINWQRAINIVKNWLADVTVKQGNLAAAKPILEDCLQIAEENSDKCRAAFCKESLAFLEEKNGNLLATIKLAESAYEDFVSLGMLTEAAETQAFIQRIK